MVIEKGQFGDMTSESDGEVNGACFAVCMAVREGFFNDGEGVRTQAGLEEDFEKLNFSKDMFVFGEFTAVRGNKVGLGSWVCWEDLLA